MQFLIDNQISVELTFNTEPTTATLLDLFEYVENVQIGLPTAVIKLNCRDNDSAFEKASLYDGAKIKASIKHATIEFPYILNLSIFGTPVITPSTLTNEGYDITIQCVLDYAKYLIALPKATYKGSVSNILKSIAKECSLKTNVITTSDSQVWFSHGRSYNTFAQHVVDHCYMSEVSLPVFGITHPGTLLLKDVVDLLKKPPTHTLGYQTRVQYTDDEKRKQTAATAENAYLFVTYETKNLSGLFNATSAYGNSYLQHSVTSANDFESTKVTFSRKLANSEINKRLKIDYKEVALNYLPLDVGNTYPNFYKALAKNIRLRNLYSNLLKVCSINEYTKIRLLDCVNVVIDLKFEDTKDEVHSGNYIVTAKTINITRNLFREMITLANYGRNMQHKDLL